MEISKKQQEEIKTEERQKREEEKYRTQVRKELEKEEKRKRSKKPLKILFILIIILIAIIQFQTNRNKDIAPPKTKEEVTQEISQKELIGKVNFDGSQFHITNQESKAWTNCRLTLNGEYRFPPEKGFMGSDSEVIGMIEASGTYSFEAGEFVLKDGTRFNPFTTKPLNFSASCDGGFGYWEW